MEDVQGVSSLQGGDGDGEGRGGRIMTAMNERPSWDDADLADIEWGVTDPPRVSRTPTTFHLTLPRDTRTVRVTTDGEFVFYDKDGARIYPE